MSNRADRKSSIIGLVGDSLLEGVHCLLHLAAGHIGLAERGLQLVARGREHVELHGALVGGHRVGWAVQGHEAHAEVQKRLGGIGVGLVEGGLAEGHAGFSGFAELHERIAHAHVGFVGRGVGLVGHRLLEVADGVLVVAQRGVGHAEVALHRAHGAVGRVGRGLAVSLDGLPRVLQLDEAVADLMVQKAHLARGQGSGGVLQAFRERHQRAAVVTQAVALVGTIE